ncbi:MAG: DUF455 family protein, partial [Planctomycetota bacterium]
MERSSLSFDSGSSAREQSSRDDSGAESIDDLAQRVLFSDSLQEKLRPRPLKPSGESQSRFREPLPERPVRPPDLTFASSSAKRPALPASANLVDEQNRGVLLHFFANHELLAAELMALALLKFHDAPAAFRDGLADTLREEQRHTRWYLNRLRECGVAVGEDSVNRDLWDVVADMPTPVDYVARLSLTFEQANLDYSRHYSQILNKAGDEASAAILKRIYEDEIKHVGYGLHWFRQWKGEDESDWDALERQLAFPLSPSRAKGNRTVFNVEGRLSAGLSADYVRRLELFERSNGRTPNVFLFNPEAENRIEIAPAPYTPNVRIQSVIDDLEVLPAFLARRDDVVLMRRPPSSAHLQQLKAAGIQLPEIESLAEDGTLLEKSLIGTRKVDRFRPWSIAPDLQRRFPNFFDSDQCHRQILEWRPSLKSLFPKRPRPKSSPRGLAPAISSRLTKTRGK